MYALEPSELLCRWTTEDNKQSSHRMHWMVRPHKFCWSVFGCWYAQPNTTPLQSVTSAGRKWRHWLCHAQHFTSLLPILSFLYSFYHFFKDGPEPYRQFRAKLSTFIYCQHIQQTSTSAFSIIYCTDMLSWLRLRVTLFMNICIWQFDTMTIYNRNKFIPKDWNLFSHGLLTSFPASNMSSLWVNKLHI